MFSICSIVHILQLLTQKIQPVKNYCRQYRQVVSTVCTVHSPYLHDSFHEATTTVNILKRVSLFLLNPYNFSPQLFTAFVLLLSICQSNTDCSYTPVNVVISVSFSIVFVNIIRKE